MCRRRFLIIPGPQYCTMFDGTILGKRRSPGNRRLSRLCMHAQLPSGSSFRQQCNRLIGMTAFQYILHRLSSEWPLFRCTLFRALPLTHIHLQWIRLLPQKMIKILTNPRNAHPLMRLLPTTDVNRRASLMSTSSLVVPLRHNLSLCARALHDLCPPSPNIGRSVCDGRLEKTWCGKSSRQIRKCFHRSVRTMPGYDGTSQLPTRCAKRTIVHPKSSMQVCRFGNRPKMEHTEVLTQSQL